MADQTNDAVVHLTDISFDEEVKDYKGVVLVDFWAPWCGPCKTLGPVIAELAQDMVGKAKVCKLDVDESPIKSHEFGIMSIPTMMLFQDGKSVDMFVGMRTKEDIAGKMNKLLEGK